MEGPSERQEGVQKVRGEGQGGGRPEDVISIRERSKGRYQDYFWVPGQSEILGYLG